MKRQDLRGGSGWQGIFLVYDTDGDGSTELFLAEKNRTYLNLLQNGASPLKGQKEITISYDSKPYVDLSTGSGLFMRRKTLFHRSI